MANDITELQAVDFALGAVISNSFNALAANGPENYKAFLGRPIKEKVFRAEHEDAGALIRKIANAEKGEGAATGSAGQRPPVLPVVAYFRKPGLSNGDVQAQALNKVAWSAPLLASLRISMLPVSLEYSMTFAAWDKPTLDKMQLAWYAFVAGRRNSRFIVPSLNGGEILEIPAKLLDPRTIMFMDSSPAKSEVGRIYAVSTEFTINTQVIMGEAVTVPDEIEIHGITTSYITRTWEG